ncbi:LCP family protein [Patescibacteria group bacterium]|nr:LCP family protein [Patescibacteria group bacterium]MBU1702908.1 LCP family protein [Patescibacteria group bacterium]MBU1954417.1 LCP family protein [Patescibacteria group bacterium]
MSNKNKNNRLHNLATSCLFLTIIILSLSFGYSLKKNTEDALNKDIKISVLINEVGEIKQNLDEKDAALSDMYSKMSLNHNQISIVSRRLEEANKELIQANQMISNQLKEKETIISDLAITNQKLQKELSIQPPDPNIENVLVVGHNAKLTDTIMLISANPNNQKINIISIPRDLYYNGRKINELYAKYGIYELQKAIAKITGLTADKYVIFNFDSFIDLIDILGGVEIDVEKKIVDNAYPGPNNTYTTVTFNPGHYTMNGSTALKYARSRKSTSDFDRAIRQQQVISAVKQSIEKLNILARLDFATRIFAKLQANISTNISLFEGLSYLQQYHNYQISRGNVISTANFLYQSKNSLGQYILLPKGKSFATIKEFVSNLINI